jgi:hypothetical protein
MMADGLTKSLYTGQHQRFIQQLGLVDITDQLARRKLGELSADDLDRFEDTLEGGETEIETIGKD